MRPVAAFCSAGWCLPTLAAGIDGGRAPQSVRAPVSGASLSPDSPAGVLRSMWRAEHPYERADHLADSLARSAVAVRLVFSQLPLSRVEGSFSVAFSVVRASLAAFMLAGKVVVLRRGLWRGLRPGHAGCGRRRQRG